MVFFRGGFAFHSSKWLSAMRLFADLRAKIRPGSSFSSLLPLKKPQVKKPSIRNPLRPSLCLSTRLTGPGVIGWIQCSL
jgi:hypothetical protein